eukprot:122486_1
MNNHVKQYILLQSLLYNLISASSICSTSLQYDGNRCAVEYMSKMTTYFNDPNIDKDNIVAFNQYLKTLPDPTYNWYSFWSNQQPVVDISYCSAIAPIESSLNANCLCQLQYICKDICDIRIQNIFADTTNVFIPQNTYQIPYDIGVTVQDCQTVMESISIYKEFCNDNNIYKSIEYCANGTLTDGTDQFTTTSEYIQSTVANMISIPFITQRVMDAINTTLKAKTHNAIINHEDNNIGLGMIVVIIIISILGFIASMLCICIIFKLMQSRSKQKLNLDRILDDTEQIEGQHDSNMPEIEIKSNYIDLENEGK